MSKIQAIQERIEDLKSKIEVAKTTISLLRLWRQFVLRSMENLPVTDGYASLLGALDKDILAQFGPLVDEAVIRGRPVYSLGGAPGLLNEQARRHQSRIVALLGEYEILKTSLDSIEVQHKALLDLSKIYEGVSLPCDAETQRMGRKDLIRVLESAAPALKHIGQDFSPSMPISSMRTLVSVLRESSP